MLVKIDLDWVAIDGIREYQIWRSVNSGALVQRARVLANHFVDELTSGDEAIYLIRAIDGQGEIASEEQIGSLTAGQPFYPEREIDENGRLEIPRQNSSVIRFSGAELLSIGTRPSGNTIVLLAQSDAIIRHSRRIELEGCQDRVLTSGQTIALESIGLESWQEVPGQGVIKGASSGSGSDTARALGIAIVRDKKPPDTDAGTFTAGGWRKRDLNDLVLNEGGNFSLAGGDLICEKTGLYLVEAIVPAVRVNEHQACGFVNFGLKPALMGTSAISSATTSSPSVISAPVDLVEGDRLAIYHRCRSTRTTFGFGRALDGASTPAIYTTLKVTRIS